MNQKEEDFTYLVEHACSALNLSHQSVKEKYRGYPVCYMQYRKNGMHSDSVEVSFDRIEASVTFGLDEKGICSHSSIYFYRDKDGDAFISHLGKAAGHYSYRKKVWIVNDSFFIKLEEQHNGLHFYCYKTEK